MGKIKTKCRRRAITILIFSACLLVNWVFQDHLYQAYHQSGFILSRTFVELRAAGLFKTNNGEESTDRQQFGEESTDRQPICFEDVPWTESAIWYNIFPETFRNGDVSNDPTSEYSEVPRHLHDQWRVIPWGQEWYLLDRWEREVDGLQTTAWHRRYGGDFQGIIDKVDYLQDLGINALYLNPVFEAASRHKYDARSLHHADPHFGPNPKSDYNRLWEETDDPATWQWTEADKLLLELVQKAHEKGMKVVFDAVFGHCGDQFFAFVDVRQHQNASRYSSWFQIRSFDDPATEDVDEFAYNYWWGNENMPLFALTDEPAWYRSREEWDFKKGNVADGPKQYIFDITRRWMDPNGDGDPSDGIDGWRIDASNDVGSAFWVEWNQLVRSINPCAVSSTEIWHDPHEYMLLNDFHFVSNYWAFAFPVKGALIDHTLSMEDFLKILEERRAPFDVKNSTTSSLSQWNVIESHDTDRLASMIVNRHRPYCVKDTGAWAYNLCNNAISAYEEGPYEVRKPNETDRRLQRLIMLFQIAYPGAPYLYYGVEAGMWGARDPDNRMPMVWEDIVYDSQTINPRADQEARNDDVCFDKALHSFTRDALALRREHSALAKGNMDVVVVDNKKSIFAFTRKLAGHPTIIAIFNRHTDPQTLELDTKLIESCSAEKPLGQIFISSGHSADVHAQPKEHEEGVFEYRLSGLTGLLLRVSKVADCSKEQM